MTNKCVIQRTFAIIQAHMCTPHTYWDRLGSKSKAFPEGSVESSKASEKCFDGNFCEWTSTKAAMFAKLRCCCGFDLNFRDFTAIEQMLSQSISIPCFSWFCTGLVYSLYHCILLQTVWFSFHFILVYSFSCWHCASAAYLLSGVSQTRKPEAVDVVEVRRLCVPGQTDFRMPRRHTELSKKNIHTAESQMFWWNWDLMVFLVRPSRGSSSVAWQDFVACGTRKGESDLVTFMNLITYETYEYLWDLWVTWGSRHVHLSMRRGCSCDVWTKWAKWSERRIWGLAAQNLWFQEFRSAVTCRFAHGEADFVRELAIQSSWQLGDGSFMSCTQGPYKITVPATTLTNKF